LKKLTVRVDKYDYKLDLDAMTLTLKLHNNHEIKLKLVVPRKRVEKYREWSNYELVVKHDNGEFWISVYFKKTIKSVEPKTLMAIDLNFDNLTLAVFTLDGRLVRLKRFGHHLEKS